MIEGNIPININKEKVSSPHDSVKAQDKPAKKNIGESLFDFELQKIINDDENMSQASHDVVIPAQESANEASPDQVE